MPSKAELAEQFAIWLAFGIWFAFYLFEFSI